MNVKVTIVVSTPPTAKDLENAKAAASKLTNSKKSVTVRTTAEGDRFHLITQFAMRTAAQYKVVDSISREFDFWLFDLAGYQDKSISFPK